MADRVKRRLFLFLDGTWNEDQKSPTNIVRMRECLKIGVDRSFATGDPSRSASGSIVRGENGNDYEYVVYYDPGVGTGVWLDRWTGGVFGTGLDLNIRQAYRFIGEHYDDGDEIFIFGFSRGAFTARSVVGYITAAGLLKPKFCTAAKEARAWKHYRTNPADRYCGEWHALQEFMYDHKTLRIKCLGVFDTVGALGVPLDWFRRLNASKYAFHDTELNAIVEISLHAVAIDERRRSFAAALWQKPKFKHFPQAKVEQTWFPGAHADIGGGYENWMDDGDDRCGRQDIAFEWMIERLRAHIPDLPLPALDPLGKPALRIDRQAAKTKRIHRPWARLDPVRLPAVRMINQIPPTPSPKARVIGSIPHAEPICEAIHISALELIAQKTVAFERRAPARYRPPNLVAALPAIFATYRGLDPTLWPAWQPYARTTPRGELAEPELRVVDWTGVIVDPKTQQHADLTEIFKLVPHPAALGFGLPT